ncbi:MAG: hypothetical protein E6Q32_03360 [Neisseriales bacterium]|nr:MAG: hypothetical protein E6Q32_03360 [Neisseriales bacterium]
MDELETKKINEEDLETDNLKKPDPLTIIILVIFAGCVTVALLYALFIGVTSIVVLKLNNPGGIKPPYNAIDFKQVAYIDNQFVVYGIDYDKPNPYSLVIFNSIDGESWDKSEIAFTKNQNVNVSYEASFNYFKGQCYLFGQTLSPLVASDCRHWHNQAIEIESAIKAPNGLVWGVPGSVVVKDMIYISTNRNGVYSSKDGIKWQNESLPNPTGNKYPLVGGSIVTGNNKIIAEASMHKGKKLIGVIYTKDLKTNTWSYQIYPETLHNITRGKDRFVGMTETSALVLVDGKGEWESYPIHDNSVSLQFGLSGYFIGIGLLNISRNGTIWETIILEDKKTWLASNLACSDMLCVAAGDSYRIVKSTDARTWGSVEFNHKNPPKQLGWYDRLLNCLFFTKN